MKKQLIATLVGGIILFVWQFLSWSMLNVHGKEFQYTANQDKILAALTENMTAGDYYLPNLPPGSSKEAQEKYMTEAIGKPWALISYHPSMSMNMGMNMTRGLAADLLAVFLLVWLFGKFAQLDFRTVLLSSLALGFIGYLTSAYLNAIWFERQSIPYLIDSVVQWGLIGVWLGWWMTRRQATA